MKKLLTVVFLTLATLALRAQDEAIFMHYINNMSILNPSHVAFDDKYEFQFNFRNQWTGFPGSPFTYAAGFEAPIGGLMGAGLRLSSENIASLNTYKAQFNYAFRHKFNSLRLAAGFAVEYSSSRLKNSALNSSFLEPDDLLIMESMDGLRELDATLGVYLRFDAGTHIGITFPDLIVAKLNDIPNQENTSNLFNLFTVFLAQDLSFAESNISLQPSFMFRRVMDGPQTLDFNLKGGFINEKLIAGLSYRYMFEDSEYMLSSASIMGLLLGTEIDNFTIFYSYDISLQDFQQYNSGSHEVSLKLTFDRSE